MTAAVGWVGCVGVGVVMVVELVVVVEFVVVVVVVESMLVVGCDDIDDCSYTLGWLNTGELIIMGSQPTNTKKMNEWMNEWMNEKKVELVAGVGIEIHHAICGIWIAIEWSILTYIKKERKRERERISNCWYI